ncbi:glycosyltransferase family 2 protein [Priestia aryabhattai]|uniref:glycosyltransferase family 2 protein n=1 Tax=Priestia aryabhattai TaxID=412384 RepID=UPI001C8E7DF7|nr:glycosyltransferase family 2 protein [Priestia aryabhattai]MBX9969229.1 glycosyltransferase family 2 protein [Priestia aryabhattai]
MINKTKIVAILTCFNRREKTLRCLKTLKRQISPVDKIIDLKIVICDDCSTDGTQEAIIKQYPDVEFVQGTGDLFWARGMARATKAAEKYMPDFYLMINDDVEFHDNMLEIMLKSYESIADNMCAVVGSTKDSNTGKLTYGGAIWNGKAIKEKTVMVEPASPCAECNLSNWNCFLIPRCLYEKVGEIDSYYEHSRADYDYSLRIVKKGYKVYVANDFIGCCSRNSIKNTWEDTSLPFMGRIKALHRRTGMPIKSSWHYYRKFYGAGYIYRVIWPYLYIAKTSLLRTKN